MKQKMKQKVRKHGGKRDLRAIGKYLENPNNVRILRYLSKIPKGKVSTYSALAKAIGTPRGARAIGNALNKNPFPEKYPCYKVIKNDGEVGGYASGTKAKTAHLKKDGIEIKNGKIDLKKYLYTS